jgi:CRISPR-associated protein Csm3
MLTKIRLLGRVFLTGDIRIDTGLHIGAGSAGLNIGGLDNPVVRDPLTRRPYIPGSSLKGKMRSLAERKRGFNPEDPDDFQRIQKVRIHICKKPEQYAACDVCQVFGLPGELDHSEPTRIIIRDVFLDPASLEGARTDFLNTEVKWEASIDRITSAAVPRQMERVPAGAVFRGFEIIFSFFDVGRDVNEEFGRLKSLFDAMQLLEDDYLGGSGSRGSGKISFVNMTLGCRNGTARTEYTKTKGADLKTLIEKQDEIVAWVTGLLREA